MQGTAIVSDTTTITHREPLCALSAAHGMPTIFANRAYLRTGGLMSYGPDIAGAFHRAAYYVDRILNGAKPSELPIEQPNTFQLTLNLRTARAINLEFPRSLLMPAEEAARRIARGIAARRSRVYLPRLVVGASTRRGG